MNPLAQLIFDQVLYFVRLLPPEQQALPCEVQVCAHLLTTRTNLVCGSALWNGSVLAACAPLANAFLLTHAPARKKYYCYGVVRSVSEGHALRYTYVLPPLDILSVELATLDDGDELLELDMSVADYARNANIKA